MIPPAHPFLLILKCSNVLVREATRLLAPLGITPAQFNILSIIVRTSRPVRPTEIAQELVVDPSSTTYLIHQIVALGWVERVPDPKDRRAYNLTLTAAGHRVFESAYQAYGEVLQGLVGQMSSTRVEELRLTLNQIIQHAPVAVTSRLGRANDAGPSSPGQ